MTLFGREPAFWTGLIVSLVSAVVGVLVGNGLITDVQAGKVTDAVQVLAQVAVLFAPLIAGLLIRPQVYSPQTVKTVAANAAASGDPEVKVTPP